MRTVSATEARVHFGELMNDVVERKESILVEKNGKPQVVILSMDEYQQLQKIGQPTSTVLEQIEYSRSLVTADLKGKTLPHPAPLIRKAREERSEQFLDLLRR
jgi:prevent-host-death family protein